MSRHKASRGAAPWRNNRSRRLSSQISAGDARRGRRLRFEPLEIRRLLAITVTTVNDLVDANDGLISLREAIVAANTTPGADTIDFDPALAASAPAIIALQHGEFELTESITINGPGSALLTIDAQQDSRIFNITANVGDFAIAGMTLTNGRVSGDNAEGDDTYSGGAIRALTAGTLRLEHITIENSRTTGFLAWGGGVFATGQLSIHDSVVRNNQTKENANGFGGGIYVIAGIDMSATVVDGNRAIGSYGGGLHVGRFATSFHVVDSVFRNNTAEYGGGIYAVRFDSNSIIDSSLFSGNSAGTEREGGNGGGINFFSGELQIRNSNLSLNLAGSSGGAVSSGGKVNVLNSQFSENLARLGGGIAGSSTIRASTFFNNRVTGSGGAINGANVEVYDSTFSGNTAGNNGGAISSNGVVTVTRSTITDNESGARGGGIFTVAGSLKVSIVAENHASAGSPDVHRTQEPVSGPFASHSLIGHADGTLLTETGLALPDANGNLIGGSIAGAIDPLLSPLTYNGGFKLPGGELLRTHALLPGSPAVNAGDPGAIAGVADIPLHDQRGNPFSRVAGGRIDIGAYELPSSMLLQLVVDNLIDESDGDFSIGDLSLREAIELANASNFDGNVDTISFDPVVFSAATTIQLVHGELVITDSVQIDPPLAGILTIDASGNDPTPGIDNGDGTNAFIIDDLNDASFIDVSFRGLSIKGGDAIYGGGILTSENLTITDCRISENSSQSFGGGVFSIGGTLAISESEVIDNRAQGDGGGVASLDGELTVLKSTISGNTARSGGGIYTYGGPATIERSQIAKNTASSLNGLGGGIHAVAGPLVVRKTQITGNSAHDAGGVYSGTSLEFVESMVSGNTATRNGGGIVGRGETKVVRSNLLDNQAGGDGGGFFGREEVLVDSSTFARNAAGGNGGGAWLEANVSDIKLLQVTVSANRTEGQGAGVWASNLDGSLAIAHSTIAYNGSPDGYGGGIFVFQGELDLDHTIVALNTAAVGPDITGLLAGTVDARYSLIGDNLLSGLVEAPVGLADAKGNLIGGRVNGVIDPEIAPLKYYGGPTPTHALIPYNTPFKSPAMDAGKLGIVTGENGVPSFDQRGIPHERIAMQLTPARIDIGAYEVNEVNPFLDVPGNYDGNLFVDAADYSIWGDHVGQTVEPGTMGDGNGDGEVDWADYEVWKWNFGQTPWLPGSGSLESAHINLEIETGQAEDEPALTGSDLSHLALEFTSVSTVRDRRSGTGQRLPLDRAATSTDQLLAAWAAMESPRRTSLTDAAVDAEADTTRAESHSIDSAFATLGQPLPRLR